MGNRFMSHVYPLGLQRPCDKLLFFALRFYKHFHDIFFHVWNDKRLEWDWQHETRANDMIWTRNVAVCFLTAQPTGCPWANYFIAQPYGLVRLRLPRLQMRQTLFVFLWHYFSQLIIRNLIRREYIKKENTDVVGCFYINLLCDTEVTISSIES